MAIVQVNFERGFAPDLASDTPGIIVDSNGLYPTPAGYRPFNALVRAAATPMAQPAMGAYLQQNQQVGGANLLFGAQTRLYQYQALGQDFVDVSGGQSFNGPSPAGPPTSGDYRTPRWRFTNFGADVIALNPNDPPQVLSAPNYNTAVALGGNPPHGALVEAVGDFVFILDSAGNDWNCSGIGNPSTWSPDIATQAANGVLGDTPGAIVGARALGANLLIYKQRAVYLGSYLGPPIIWGFSLLAGDRGAVSNEAIVDLGASQAFVGFDNFYLCDGAPPRPIKSPLRNWFFEQSLDNSYANLVWGVWDRLRAVVVWYYPSVAANPSGSLDRYLCWSPSLGRWSTGSLVAPVQAVAQAPVNLQGVLQYSPLAVFSQALILSDNAIYQMSGTPKGVYLTSGDLGIAGRLSLLRGARPRFSLYPGANAAQLQPLYRFNLGDQQYAGAPAPLTSYGWFSLRQSARYHAAKLSVWAECEIIGLELDWQVQGTR